MVVGRRNNIVLRIRVAQDLPLHLNDAAQGAMLATDRGYTRVDIRKGPGLTRLPPGMTGGVGATYTVLPPHW